MSGHDWRRRALCFGMDLADFFPVSSAVVTEEAAKACRACPVAAECLAWAQETLQIYGTWGGVSEDERLKLRNPRRKHRRTAADQQDEQVA